MRRKRLPDLDAANLRDWMAAVGLLRLISETTPRGRLVWRGEHGRYRLELRDVPPDLAERCAAWVKESRAAWRFADRANVDFGAEVWREHAREAEGLAASLWCAIASDAVTHRSGTKLQASGLEYGHGGGWQHWLTSMRSFLEGNAVTAEHFARVLAGGRDDDMKGKICRWDHACERDHAYRAKAPTNDKMTQDQTVNALAAIGLASCPSAPTSHGLVTPLVERDGIFWPVWLEPLRIADLDAAVCCDRTSWTWPTMRGRRWLSNKLYCFARGELCEP
jgi:hypothetical protein